MFAVNRSSESGVVYVDQNVEKCDRNVGNSLGKFESRVERLDERERA